MPEEQKVTCKLSALLSADVKGSSILIAYDEVFTIKTIKECTIFSASNECFGISSRFQINHIGFSHAVAKEGQAEQGMEY